MGKKGSDGRSSKERETPATQDTLQVASQTKRKLKSPTPGGLRSRSATPVRGRSSTPFSVYIAQRSTTPTGWRSITPFLRREEKEKTPFELGTDIKTQLVCNKAVLDHALVMDISVPEESQKPVRYITSDLSIIDRASVMDVSNVEVIYVVEEYEEEEEEEIEIVEEKKPKKKSKKGRRSSTDGEDDADLEGSDFDREGSDESDESVKKGKKKSSSKKKDKKEKSPSPKLTLNLEIGGGAKASKKMFESASAPKPPPKKTKAQIQQEEKAKAAAKAAEEERIKKEKAEEEKRRQEEEQRLREEAEAAAAAELEQEEEYDYEEEQEEENIEEEEVEEKEPIDVAPKEPEPVVTVVEEPAKEKSPEREPDSDDDIVRPDPEDQNRWRRLGEGEDIIVQLRKFSHVEHRHHSEKESDAEWKKRRLNARLPFFIKFLQDRAVALGTRVQISCAIDGPYHFIKWFKNDRELETDSSFRVKNVNNVLSITFFHTNNWHAGKYKCVIGNPNGEVASSCNLTVYEEKPVVPARPSFKYLKEHYNSRDDELTIECQVQGTPKPKVVWTKFCTPITSGYKFTVIEEPNGVCKLMLYKPTIKDNATYLCTAENYCGIAQVSHVIEVGKHLETHVPGIFHARNRLLRDKEVVAKKAIEEALQSKAESERKRDLAEMHRQNGTVDPSILIKYKLRFTIPLQNRSVLEGSNVKMICKVSGPNPTCTWLKNDNPLVWSKNVKNLSFKERAEIELTHVTVRTAGFYKCIAKNDFGEAVTFCNLKVHTTKVAGEEEPPTFEGPIKDVYLANDENLVIDATVRGIPLPIITWTKDDFPIVFNERIVYNVYPEGLCELIIHKPTVEDAGTYCCTARNKLGIQKETHAILRDGIQISRTSSDSSLLAIPSIAKGALLSQKTDEEEAELRGMEHKLSIGTDSSIKDKLYFIAKLANRFVVEGATVKLQAVVGGPNPTCHWLKNGQPVEPSEHVKIFYRHGLTMLKIPKMRSEDAGDYTVVAQNGEMEISSTANLHVYEAKVSSDIAPVFIKPIKDAFYLNSNELILDTALRGQPAPAIYWYKDAMPLENEGRYHIHNLKDGILEFIVDKPTNKDSGKYVVRAENRAGVAEISHYVAFEGKASHIADNIHGVFHADKTLLKYKLEDGKERKLVTFEPSKHKRPETIPDPTPKQSLFFYASLSNRYVSENTRVKFQAVVGGPKPIFTWFKDGKEIEAGDHVKIFKREGLSILRIQVAKMNDAGTYTVVVRNPYSEITSSAKLHVYQIESNTDIAPVFLRPLTYHYKLHNNELFFDTAIRAQPTPQIWWYKDGTEIKNYGRFAFENHNDGTLELRVHKPEFKDSGRYYICAVNRAGSAEIASNVIFDGLIESHIAGNTHGVFHADKNMKKSNPDDLLNKLTRVIKYAKEEKEQVSEGEEPLSEEDIDPADPRRIKDKEHIMPAKSEPRQQAPVAVQPKAQQPINIKKQIYFLNFLPNRTVKAGSNVQWIVTIVGPNPKVRWFHNNKRISFGTEARFSFDNGAAVLILFSVTEKNAGEYMIHAKGPINQIESKCSLEVYSTDKAITSSPTFTVGIKENYMQHDHILVLDCRVRGQPRPEIQWMKGIHPIESNDRYEQVDLDDGYSKLIINHPTEEDSGRYTCIARNEAGENKMIHTVEFQGAARYSIDKTLGFFHRNTNKPHLVAPLGNQTVQLGGTIAFTAEFVQSLSQIDVQWFLDREPLAGNPDVKMFMNRGLYTVVIMDVSYAYEGTYICRARNSFGQVDSYATADIMFSPEENENPPIFKSRPAMEQKLNFGDTLSIPFEIQDNPTTKITLMKGYRDITNSERVKKEFNGETSTTTFIIENVEVNDTSTYFVVARNNFGTDRLVVSVNVAYPPTK